MDFKTTLNVSIYLLMIFLKKNLITGYGMYGRVYLKELNILNHQEEKQLKNCITYLKLILPKI